jgi:hypothetical protein
MRLAGLCTVLFVAAAGCGTSGPAPKPGVACWEEILRLRTNGASPAEWLVWAEEFPSPKPRRDLTGWTRKKGGTYSLGNRRYLLTNFAGGPYWASSWTRDESEFKVQVPNASYVWVECDRAITRVEDLRDDVCPQWADGWIIVVHDGRIGIVSIRDLKGLVVDHPRPDLAVPGPVEPVPIEFERKPSTLELIEMDGDRPVLGTIVVERGAHLVPPVGYANLFRETPLLRETETMRPRRRMSTRRFARTPGQESHSTLRRGLRLLSCSGRC